MDNVIRIVLSKKHVEQLNKKKTITFKIKATVIEIRVNHPIELAPIDKIGEDRDDLLRELEYLREQVKFLKSKEPHIKEFDDVIRVAWCPGMVGTIAQKHGLKLFYNRNGRFLGIDIPKQLINKEKTDE